MSGPYAGGLPHLGGSTCGAAPVVSAHGALRARADQLRREAARLQASAQKLETFSRSLPGLMPEQAAEKLCEIFALNSSGSITAAFESRVARLRDEASWLFVEADDFELLAKSLPGLMPAEAHEALVEKL